jgi:hypothetical protein
MRSSSASGRRHPMASARVAGAPWSLKSASIAMCVAVLTRRTAEPRKKAETAGPRRADAKVFPRTGHTGMRAVRNGPGNSPRGQLGEHRSAVAHSAQAFEATRPQGVKAGKSKEVFCALVLANNQPRP